MAGGKAPGPAGSSKTKTLIDIGTQCLQSSPRPGTIFGLPDDTSVTAVRFSQKTLVGESARKVGFNFDGTPAEDMTFGDKPFKSAKIKKDDLFNKTDKELIENFTSLVKWTSTGDMQEVALAMVKKFAQGNGGVFHSPILDAEIKSNKEFTKYHQSFRKKLEVQLKKVMYNPYRLGKISPLKDFNLIKMDLLDFSSLSDKVGGLGITIHQIWSTKASFGNFYLDCAGDHWKGDIYYTFYDHFGLDWEDIEKFGYPKNTAGLPGLSISSIKSEAKNLFNDSSKDFLSSGFKSWYILQHYRKAKPFITKITITMPITGLIK